MRTGTEGPEAVGEVREGGAREEASAFGKVGLEQARPDDAAVGQVVDHDRQATDDQEDGEFLPDHGRYPGSGGIVGW